MVIIFSTDQYHKEIDPRIKQEYKSKSIGLTIQESGLLKNLIKTGFSECGTEFIYKTSLPKYEYENDIYTILDGIYITSNGNITTDGDGMYEDMDKNNLGNLKEKSLEDILKNKEKCKKKKYNSN